MFLLCDPDLAVTILRRALLKHIKFSSFVSAEQTNFSPVGGSKLNKLGKITAPLVSSGMIKNKMYFIFLSQLRYAFESSN